MCASGGHTNWCQMCDVFIQTNAALSSVIQSLLGIWTDNTLHILLDGQPFLSSHQVMNKYLVSILVKHSD